MKTSVTLSLISHTNVGKTTLARTLLRRDVGEVLDQAHVTDRSEAHLLIETPDARLELWDTPGFGDTRRLLKRLRHEKDPLGWFLHRVWDRIADRPMWCSQEAVRNVKEQADVVLYLVNASEEPDHAGYVPLELELLSWMGRPVLLLLNQVGAPDDGTEARWRRAVESWPVVRGLLSLDAFARCWTEERLLLEQVAGLVDSPAREAMGSLIAAWNARNLRTFHASCRQMADYLAGAAADREAVGRSSARSDWARLAALVDALKFLAVDKRPAKATLEQRLDHHTQELMSRLIVEHGLEGESATKIEQRLQDSIVKGWFNKYTGAAVGTGTVAPVIGLAADLMAGGLTLGGGLIAGGILGALGGSALGAGYRWISGEKEPYVKWTPEFLDQLCRQVVLRYLAVAHFGRGRGAYEDVEQPDHWNAAVGKALSSQRSALHRLWARAESGGEEAGDRIRLELAGIVEQIVRTVLCREYPHASVLFS